MENFSGPGVLCPRDGLGIACATRYRPGRAWVGWGAALVFLLPACTATGPAPVPISYLCQSGERIVASYPDTDTAVIEYRGQVRRLHIAISASGARYVGGAVEWWTKGTGRGASGTLFRHGGDDMTGETLESCEIR